MRTLSTQVRMRRLVRSFTEAVARLSEPAERPVAGMLVERLQDLAAEVRESWRREAMAGRPGQALDGFVMESLRTVELAIAGVAQEGSDLELLRSDFEGAALPLEVFLRGLDAEPALERSA
jgi:hypothetical protein